ncbi:MAG: glucose-6-phosphate isomerase [Gammaproteobacteria bacterium]|nr:glucose-6-phosphate isomerase [Gammaproteobacteria bacterium]
MHRSLPRSVLELDCERLRNTTLNALFEQDPSRASRYQIDACGLFLDFSKNVIDDGVISAFAALGAQAGLDGAKAALFSGDTVNSTEGRAALHTLLRQPATIADPASSAEQRRVAASRADDVHDVLRRMDSFCLAVHSGDWRGAHDDAMTDVVNIGIGGSDLGPKMVCTALQDQAEVNVRAHFVSNIDATQLARILDGLDPKTTLFVVASKTFGTQETLTNALSARAWLVAALGEDAVSRHFVAVSTNRERVVDFGIDPANMFGFWDWVGGRYSLWSAIGLSIGLSCGMPLFRRLLAGAHQMDEHFRSTPMAENMPVLMALMQIWGSVHHGAQSRAVLPYDYALSEFPAYLQQLEMESCGKSVTHNGEPVDGPTGAVIWGGPGNNGQHAFYQLMHQGTVSVPSDFIVPIFPQRGSPEHDTRVLANAFGQAQALMRGRTAHEADMALLGAGVEDATERARLVPHMVMGGNQPSNTIVYERLTPEVLGALIALYEHKVFVQSVIWGINPFDQYGVELGKQLATVVEADLQGTGELSAGYDSSTTQLIERARGARRRAS